MNNGCSRIFKYTKVYLLGASWWVGYIVLDEIINKRYQKRIHPHAQCSEVHTPGVNLVNFLCLCIGEGGCSPGVAGGNCRVMTNESTILTRFFV